MVKGVKWVGVCKFKVAADQDNKITKKKRSDFNINFWKHETLVERLEKFLITFNLRKLDIYFGCVNKNK